MDKKNAKLSLGWDNSKIHILFAANPNRPEKNFKLAKEVFTLLNQSDYEIHYFTNVDHDIIVNYFNASDIVLLTSLWEGSPNVIKEAMACNVPIVSTNVGDISEIIKNTEGCFVTDFDSRVIADKIILATEYIQGTSGRSDIKHLDSKIIAKRIIDIYNKIILK
jgi:glycosyltransferase involved in cell wall biosynthesis